MCATTLGVVSFFSVATRKLGLTFLVPGHRIGLLWSLFYFTRIHLIMVQENTIPIFYFFKNDANLIPY